MDGPPLPRSRAAVASVLLGCVSLISLFVSWIADDSYFDSWGAGRVILGFGILAFLPAIICGHIGVRLMRIWNGGLGGEILAVTGLATGYSVLAILFLLPGKHGGHGGPQARRVLAKTEVMDIVVSMKQYESEYGRRLVAFEGQERSSRDLTFGQGVLHNSLLFDTLRSLPAGLNSDFHLNPRKIVFFEARPVKDPAQPRLGFADQDGVPKGIKGSLFDPWGREYLIRIHYDRTKPFVAPDGTIVDGNIIVWSLGPDGIQGTADDIVSWK